MAEIGLAASVIALIDLAAKLGVLCSRYCADVKNARRDVRHILNEADRLAVTLREVERLLKGSNGAKSMPLGTYGALSRTADSSWMNSSSNSRRLQSTRI